MITTARRTGLAALIVTFAALSALLAGLAPSGLLTVSGHRDDPAPFPGTGVARVGAAPAMIVVNPAVKPKPPSPSPRALAAAAARGSRPAPAITDTVSKLATFAETNAGLRAIAGYAKQVRADLAASGDTEGLRRFDAAFRPRDTAIANAALPGFTAMLAALPATRQGLAALDTIPARYGAAFVALPPDLQQRYAIAVTARHDAIDAVIARQRQSQAAPAPR